MITRVEVAAALAKAVRTQRLDRNEAEDAEQEFLGDWDDFTRIGVMEVLVGRAGDLAWRHNLRGYDAAQLAAALAWQEMREDMQDEIVFACFDHELVQAGYGRRPQYVAGIGSASGPRSRSALDLITPARRSAAAATRIPPAR